MRKLLFLLAFVGTIGAANAQFEIEGGGSSIAAVSGSYIGAGSGGFLGASYDFAWGDFKIAPEVQISGISSSYVDYDFYYETSFVIVPVVGVRVGHDNIYAKVDVDFDGAILYGLGGSIGLGGGHRINISSQAGNYGIVGIGYTTLGYAFRF